MLNIDDLKNVARTLKIDSLKSIYKAKSGHIGGCLSAAEMITALYFHVLRVDPSNPQKNDRDRFVLSKGHAAPVLYAALARRGFFPLEDLDHLRMVHSHLQGAPNIKTPGIDMSSGPLGQGLSAAVGMALNAHISNLNYKVWCMVGDGEIQEGQIWEAAMTASKYQLKNLVCIIDYNKVQMSGTIEKLMPVVEVESKFKSFGWRTVNISNGNCMEEVVNTFDKLWDNDDPRPIAVIANTIKGNGISFMEGKSEWHGAIPTAEQYAQALKELEESK
jgi:transketolase